MILNVNLIKYAIALILIMIVFALNYSVSASDNSQLNSYVETGSTLTGNDQKKSSSSDRSAELRDLFKRFINFALVIVILFVIYKKMKLKDMLSARSEEIKQRLEDLEREKEEAENRCREVEGLLRDFEIKRKEMIEAYKKEGLAEKEKILSEAKARVKKIIDQSEITIQQEIEAARERLKQDVFELVAEKAGKLLAVEIDEDDQEKMVVEFVEKVGRLN